MTIREDQKIIAGLIEAEAKVIDIGCGKGSLLAFLQEQKHVIGHGLEIEAEKVSEAVSQGVSVIQGDGDSDLQYYPDKSFDYAVLSQTLQIMKNPKDVFEEALRIANKVIVAIPNFGHYFNRLYFSLRGRMPVSAKLPYEWYETPNIHFCTIKDFVVLAEELGCKIEKRFYVTSKGSAHVFHGKGSFVANLRGEYGIFVLSRESF